ncbi:response regulator transcription factor [Paenibacillus sp. JDR-2]|uniref:response regulator transcription factor n=1 Tax=Paenibacillus sp. (strain JDR-2) TaxID=324057 RepID=UPI0001666AAC|nr:response regulator [Paenibacillus sp. JDR-2]ACT03002.1 two component transcriptional regulator, AraC family [Paenibacillus sp. JDR-2]
MYKVLIADDEVLDLEGMRLFIPWTELGLEVVAAVNNGFDAYEVLKGGKIDILVTDVHMPSMSGLELARKAQETESCLGLRVIFVSGYQDFHYVKQALSLRAYSYVLKPMDDSELVDALVHVTKELDEVTRKQEEERQWREAARRTAPRYQQLPENVSVEPGKHTKLIQEVTAYMKEHLNRSLTLKEVAERFAFSPNYLGLMFKEEMGVGFSEYVITMRMERAGELLKDPKVKIYEVADQVGYRYMPYFSRQFKETFGMTPIDFRRHR